MCLYFLMAEDPHGAGSFLRAFLHLVPEDKRDVEILPVSRDPGASGGLK